MAGHSNLLEIRSSEVGVEEMPRLIVTTEGGRDHTDETVVVHDERVLASSLDTEHSSAQLIERVGWALQDAEKLEAEQA
jgi:hypothetical protein